MIWLPSSEHLASSLLKIPVLFASTTLATLAMTPPTPPPAPEESAKYQDKRDVFRLNAGMSIAVKCYKIIYWGNFVCESAAILAKHFPSPAAYDALSLLTRNPSQADNIRHTRAWFAGCALLACGGIIRLVCYRTLGKFFTWQLAVKKDHALITHGPYSIVRHPSYLGSLMLGIGTVLCQFGPGSWYHECIGWDNWGSKVWTAAWGGWSLILAGVLAARVPLEDEVLHREFGAEWEAYANRTRYKLIPYIY